MIACAASTKLKTIGVALSTRTHARRHEEAVRQASTWMRFYVFVLRVNVQQILFQSMLVMSVPVLTHVSVYKCVILSFGAIHLYSIQIT